MARITPFTPEELERGRHEIPIRYMADCLKNTEMRWPIELPLCPHATMWSGDYSQYQPWKQMTIKEVEAKLKELYDDDAKKPAMQ